MDAQAYERKYLNAMRLSDLRLDEARKHLDDFKAASADRHRVIVLEAHYAYHLNRRNYGSSLRTIMTDVIEQADVVPETKALAFVVATKLAMILNDVATMNRLICLMDGFWQQYQGLHEVHRWRAACEHNVGIHVLRNGRYEEAIVHFNRMLAYLVVSPESMCWLAQVYAHLATAYARLGDTTTARKYAELGEQYVLPINHAFLLYAWGEIAIAEGSWETAKALLLNAYRKAEETDNPFVMAYAQVLLCRVYHQLGNYDAFWYAHDLAHNISKNNGVPHVFGVLAELAAGVPKIIREEVLRA